MFLRIIYNAQKAKLFGILKISYDFYDNKRGESMAKRKKQSKDLIRIGHYSFIAGIIIAIIVGLIPQLRGDIAIWIMVVLGIIVGLLNITAQEINSFLIAAVALIIASSASALSLAVIWPGLTSILGNVIIFIAPAAIIVSVLSIVRLADVR